MSIIENARCFSIAAHEAIQQKRKYTGEPYFWHPMAVGSIVWGAYGDENMLAAAYLHDVVEDTGVTLSTIENLFGEDVTTLVAGLTDVSKPSDGNRAERKRIDREHTAEQSPRCKTIKLADLIHNSQSILEYDREFAKTYIKEKELLLEVLKEGDTNLWKAANDIVISAKRDLGLVTRP